MPTPPISDELCVEALQALQAHGGNKSHAAESLGLPRCTYKNRLRRAAERGLDIDYAVPEGFVIRNRTDATDGDGNLRSRSLRMAADPGDEFATPDGHRIKGVSALVDAQGRTVQRWIKTASDNTERTVDYIREAFADLPQRATLTDPPAYTDADLLTVYPIADQHIGMLAWGRETGEDYDVAIACERLRSAVGRLVAKAYPSQGCVILNLGDYFHSDDGTNETPMNHHKLDVDGRYQKVIRAGIETMRDLIDLALQKHTTVRVRNIPGNHDPHSSLALTVALEGHYFNEPRVLIDDDPGEFWFDRFGITQMGAHHGHKSKAEELARLLAERRPADWAASRHRMFFTGHVHHDRARDIGSVRVESFRTGALKDAYAVGHGYTTPPGMRSITLHAEHAEIERHVVSVV